MAYRNGTYIAFHANGSSIPTESDIKYYYLIKAWTAKTDDDFSFINSHDKTDAVRDSSLRETLRSRLAERLRNSKNLLLLIGKTTKLDTDWVPYEIEYAVDKCKIPIIAAYVEYETPIYTPANFAGLWPEALKKRIENNTASCIHIPFKKEVLSNAINKFSISTKPPAGGIGTYSQQEYRSFGL